MFHLCPQDSEAERIEFNHANQTLWIVLVVQKSGKLSINFDFAFTFKAEELVEGAVDVVHCEKLPVRPLEISYDVQVARTIRIVLSNLLLQLNLLDLIDVDHVLERLCLHLSYENPSFNMSWTMNTIFLSSLLLLRKCKVFIVETLGENLVVLHL